MKAVPDTNVLISAILTKGTCHKIILKGFKGEYKLITSKEIINEFEETLKNIQVNLI